jgi:hypothetical protein
MTDETGGDAGVTEPAAPGHAWQPTDSRGEEIECVRPGCGARWSVYGDEAADSPCAGASAD